MFYQVIIIAAAASLASASIATVVDVKAPQPYKFGYNIKDKTSQQYREEVGNGAGVVKGSYGFADASGIQRQVNYVADALGFRAQVNTNEPGTANQNPATVEVNSNAPNAGNVVVSGVAVRNNLLTAPKSAGVRYRVPLQRYKYGIGNGLGVNGLGSYFGNLGYGYDSDLVNFGYGIESDLGTLGYGFGGNLGSFEYGYGNDLEIFDYGGGLDDLGFGYGYDFGNTFGYSQGIFGNIGC